MLNLRYHGPLCTTMQAAQRSRNFMSRMRGMVTSWDSVLVKSVVAWRASRRAADLYTVRQRFRVPSVEDWMMASIRVVSDDMIVEELVVG